MVRFLIFLTLIGVLITSCVPQKPIITLDPSATCDEIVHPALLSVPFDELAQGRKQAEEWIITQFPTATVEFIPTSSPADSNDVSINFDWSEGDKGFYLLFAPNSDIEYILQNSKQHPTLGMILDCFGDPMYYALDPQAVLGQAAFGYRLSIYYPDRGLEFRDSNWEATVAKRYDATSVMNDNISVTLWVR